MIIPETAEMRISLRSFSPEVKHRLLEAVQQLAHSTAEAYGLKAEIEVMPDYPVTVNDEREAIYSRTVIQSVFGPDRARELVEPLSASEDFAHVLAEVPGTFALIGAEPEEKASETNHSPRASFADSSIDDVTEFLTNAAWFRES
ncbi:hippurate hydrolase [Brevibacterium sp. 239c]|nr:hippurate hydrolase [Brevibacterium sp. 239c]